MDINTTAYKPADAYAALKMIEVHKAKLHKAMTAKNWADACAALRALEADCAHAGRVTAALSGHQFGAQARMQRAANLGATS